MKNHLKKAVALAVFVMALALSGCMSKPVDTLYSLPQLPEQYVKLQSLIDSVLQSGADYASPESGDNRQAVQLHDLNGDGKDEVIAFFSIQGSNKPLKIYLYEYVEGAYKELSVIEGDGMGIDSIAYEDMDGDGLQELIVGWKMSAEVKMLFVYSGSNYMKANSEGITYTSFTLYDMKDNGFKDLVVVNMLGAEAQSSINMYSLMPDGELVSVSAPITYGAETLSRMRTGRLSDNKPCVYLDCGIGGGISTDIFTYSGDMLKNVLADQSGSVLVDIKRTYNVYSTDLDGDGIVEVPKPVALPSQSETVYYGIEWYDYDSHGNEKKVCDTFHNYSDGWYLILPDGWLDGLSVRREDTVSGERNIIFSEAGENGEFSDFLVISVLSGENREEKATENGRFLLKEEDNMIYAGKILDSRYKRFTVTEETVSSNFRRQYSDWITG